MSPSLSSPKGGESTGKRQHLPLEVLIGIWRHAARVSEPRNQFPLTRVALIERRRGKKEFPICSLWALTCLQVPDLPRQRLDGPSRDSRLCAGGILA